MLTTHDFVAISTVIICAVYFSFMAVFRKKVIKDAPGFLITIGIAFTFYGIAMGLKEFDINDPSNSIGSLIDGIRTVFWGSLAGVIASIVIRIINALVMSIILKERQNDEMITNRYLEEHTELIDLNRGHHVWLEKINHNQEESNKNLLKGLEQLGLSFSEYSKTNMQDTVEKILPILQRMEDSQNKSHTTFVIEELRNLKYSFDKFAEQQAEQNTRIFIEALEKAIHEFNEQLASQLGENFKQLNQAVYKLTDWQENYAHHVKTQTEAYQSMLGYVAETQEKFDIFAEKAASFNEITDSINTSLNQLANRQDSIDESLQVFYQELEAKVVDVHEVRKLISESFENMKEMHNEHRQQALKLSNSTIANVNQISEKQGEIAKKSMENIELLQSKVNQEFSQTEKRLEEQLFTLQKHHENALNSSLQSLARQLASLSAQFAKDYEPITTNLRKILQIGSKG